VVAIPKPPPHRSVSERYADARQRYIASKAPTVPALIPCECQDDGSPCPRAARVVVDRLLDGTYTTSGHVHHRKKRSTHPGLREEFSNLALVDVRCHAAAHGGGR